MYLQRQYDHMMPADKIVESGKEAPKGHPNMIDILEDALSDQTIKPTKVEKDHEVCTYNDEREQ